ncbi:hypothetical protein ABFT80_06150 [Mesorhizobium sp. SB112]|uniref:hypothetical protein n=1 Tax=Mesorhizobium sp. SB112 TaxID=3151853 RepID=UPI003263AA89
MIATECHPFSTHMVVMACSELTGTIAKQRGVGLPLSFDHLIRKDRLAEWRRATVQAYNFFKHADRDPSAIMTTDDVERIEVLNDLTMLANISHLHTLGCNLDPAFSTFSMGITLIYPDVMDWKGLDEAFPDIAAARLNLGNPSRKTLLQAMRYALIKRGFLPDDRDLLVFS